MLRGVRYMDFLHTFHHAYQSGDNAYNNFRTTSRLNLNGVAFHLRFGIFLGRTVLAVIARSKFITMTPATCPLRGNDKIVPLDPAKPYAKNGATLIYQCDFEGFNDDHETEIAALRKMKDNRFQARDLVLGNDHDEQA